MRMLGNWRKRTDAESNCLRYVREAPPSEFWDKPGVPTCVIQKTKCKDHPSPKTYVCYRAWVDLDRVTERGEVMDIEDWSARTPWRPR